MTSAAPTISPHPDSLAAAIQELEDMLPQRILDDVAERLPPLADRVTKIVKATLIYIKTDLQAEAIQAEAIQELYDFIAQSTVDTVAEQFPDTDHATTVVKAALVYMKRDYPIVVKVADRIPREYLDNVPEQYPKDSQTTRVMKAAFAYLTDWRPQLLGPATPRTSQRPAEAPLKSLKMLEAKHRKMRERIVNR